MIYLIGGASRAGKTYLARRLMAKMDTPLLELDYLKMGLARGMPEYGVHPLDDEPTIGNLLWPIVSQMIETMVENGDDYIVEGTYILPEFATGVHDAHGPGVRSCFLGYADTSPAEKLAEVRRYGGGADDPLGAYDDERALAELEHFVSFSRCLRSECARLELVYFEVADRERTVNEALRHLLQPDEGMPPVP